MHRIPSIIGIGLVAILLRLHCAISVNSFTDEQWEQFKQKYNKIYSDALDQNRRKQWESNLEYIAQHNLEAGQGKHTYTLGENKYADLNLDEYRQLLGLKSRKSKSRMKRRAVYCDNHANPTLPLYVNWTHVGWVTPVEDQGSICRSGWSFSACGALEGLYYNQTRTLVVLSEQNLIDCSFSSGTDGCSGGYPQEAFAYVKTNGIETSADYPYAEMDWNANDTAYGPCTQNASFKVNLTITGYQEIESRNEDALQQAVALTGPVSVSIDADSLSFQLYQSGVYYNPNCSRAKRDLDHAVLAVGYGKYPTTDYWLLKNSWGTSWGMDGYMMMARNAGNMCGIATYAAFPIDYTPVSVLSCHTTTTTPTTTITTETTMTTTTTTTTTTSATTATTSKFTIPSSLKWKYETESRASNWSPRMYFVVVIVAVASCLNIPESIINH